jgi:hypothetical protein
MPGAAAGWGCDGGNFSGERQNGQLDISASVPMQSRHQIG